MSCFAYVLRRWLWPVSGVVGLCMAVLLNGWQAQFRAACDTVRAETLRLHIRAAGDTLADQTVKLQVRDAVLQLTEPLYAAAQNAAEAKAVAARCLPVIALRARLALCRQGAAQPVAVCLTEEYFAAKRYGDYTLPAGRYAAVCVQIGSGRGRNWWCCLYPQLCAAACSGYADEEAQALVVGDYRVRFRIAEWWQRLQQTAKAQQTEPPAPSLVCTME